MKLTWLMEESLKNELVHITSEFLSNNKSILFKVLCNKITKKDMMALKTLAQRIIETTECYFLDCEI